MKKRVVATIVAGIMFVFFCVPICNEIFTGPSCSRSKVCAYEKIEGYPDFSLDMYVANLLSNPINEDTAHMYNHLSFYLNDFDSPNSIFFELLRDDRGFQSAVSSWEGVNLVFDPGSNTAKTLDEEGYYEAIILNALSTTFNEEGFYSGYLKKSQKMLNDSYSYLQNNSQLVYYVENYKKLNSNEVERFKKELDDYYKEAYPDLDAFSKAMDYWDKVFKACDTAYELIDKIHAYNACYEITNEMKQFVNLLYEQCDGRQNLAMKQALLNIATACDSYNLSILEAIADTSFKVCLNTMLKIGDDFMKKCVACFPAGKIIILTQAITKSAVNFVLSTDKIIEQYYKMEKLCNFEMLLRDILNFQRINYQKAPSEQYAKLLLTSLDVLFQTYSISCDYASEYAKLMCEENILAKLFGNTDQYNHLKGSINGIRCSLSLAYNQFRVDGFLRHLQDEHPEIYKAYCSQVENTYEPIYIKTLAVEFEKEIVEIGIEDDYCDVSVNINPMDATNQDIIYQSSDPTIAVCSYGRIYPYAIGKTLITATTVDGGHTTIMEVRVVEGHGENGVCFEDEPIGTVEIGDIFYDNGMTYQVISDTEVSLIEGNKYFKGALYLSGSVGYLGRLFTVRRIEADAFRDSDSITLVEIPSGVEEIESCAFAYCTQMKKLILPETVTWISEFVFSNCYNLEEVIVRTENILYSAFPFERCDKLKTIIYEDNITQINAQSDWMPGAGSIWSTAPIETVIIPDSVSCIGDFAFDGCGRLKNIQLPHQLRKIGDHAFDCCFALQDIEIPNGVIEIGSGAFGNTALHEIEIPNSVEEIGDYAFYGCENLTDIEIPNGIKRIENGLLEGCVSLSEFIIPNTVTEIGDNVCYDCHSLTNVVIPKNVTKIGENAFSHCDNLKTVVMCNGTTQCSESSFYDGYYENCIEKVIFADGVSKISCSFSFVFSGTSEVVIPQSVTTIDDYQFSLCFYLTDVYYQGNNAKWNNITIGEGNDDLYLNIHFNSATDKGDVNLDDVFNVEDIVMMQRFLLHQGSIVSREAGDLNQDGCLNGFDLCIMKRMVRK